MSREIKFTTDGKKVVVIGSLNSQEKIVQEIFIVDGSEIPSGEHFVVKSLHDAPAISWKEKNEKEIEERYNKKQKEFEMLEKDLRKRQSEVKKHFQYLGKCLQNVNEKTFSTLSDFLTGDIKWVVEPNYCPKITEWKDYPTVYDEEFRLISLFGKDDGSLNYCIGRYSDYSGGHSNIIPFANYEDALAKFKELVQQATISEELILTAKKHNIELDIAKVAEWKQKQSDSYLSSIKNYEKTTADYKEKLEKLSNY